MKKFICISLLGLMVAIGAMTYVVEAGAPLYAQPTFSSIEGLVEWIETTDAEAFQSGRFEECILATRNRGGIFIALSDDANIRMTHISVLSHFASRGERNHEGNMFILFEFSSPETGRVHASVNQINPRLAAVYAVEGIGGFFRARRSTIVGNYRVSEKTIAIRDSYTGEFVEQTIPYVVNYGLGPDSTIAIANFIIDGIEFRVQYYTERGAAALSSLVWDTIPITYRPPQPPRPPVLQTIRLAIGSTVYTIDDVPHESDVAPFIDPAYDRAMIPLRVVSEALGANVDWIPTTRTVWIDMPGASYQLIIDTPLPGGMGVPILYQDRVFVPVRYVAEILGATPRWDGSNAAVYIYHYVVPS